MIKPKRTLQSKQNFTVVVTEVPALQPVPLDGLWLRGSVGVQKVAKGMTKTSSLSIMETIINIVHRASVQIWEPLTETDGIYECLHHVE